MEQEEGSCIHRRKDRSKNKTGNLQEHKVQLGEESTMMFARVMVLSCVMVKARIMAITHIMVLARVVVLARIIE